jgi:phage shock protein PspC (stress-responsive transcriptional regulator)
MSGEERVACPYCREMILSGAIKCKECGSNLSRKRVGQAGGAWQTFDWTRNQPNRKVLGVAACIANNLRVSATIVRLAFVLLTFVSLLGLILYLALAAVIPPEQGSRSLFETAVDSLGAAFDSFNGRNHPASAAPTSAAMPPVPAALPEPEQQPKPDSGA